MLLRDELRLIDFCGLGCLGFAARSEELLFELLTVVVAAAVPGAGATPGFVARSEELLFPLLTVVAAAAGAGAGVDGISEELLFDDFTVVAAVADSENAAAENNATNRYSFIVVSLLRMYAEAQRLSCRAVPQPKGLRLAAVTGTAAIRVPESIDATIRRP